MVGASTSVYEFDNSAVRCQHVYTSVWTPLTNKTRKCIMQKDNRHDKYTETINCSNIQKENTHIKRY